MDILTNSIKQKIFNDWYPYHVWLMCLAIGPILWMTFLSINNGGIEPITDMIVMLFISFLIGAILSLPILLVYVLAFRILKDWIVGENWLKFVLILLAILGAWITFAILFRGGLFSNHSFVFPLSYNLSTLIAGFFFKIKVVKEPWSR